MTKENQPWTHRFRPSCQADVVGNERALSRLRTWIRSWEKGIPKERAAFLHGPPGVGKTSCVVAIANDLDIDLLEVNASDFRTKKRLEGLVGRASLQTVTITGKRRMILFDELEGVSGQQDRGGIASIRDIIKETMIPIVLIATSPGEKWQDKFRPLVDLSTLIEFSPVPFGAMVRRLRECATELGLSVDEEVLEHLADRSQGDLRSTLNDLEVISKGKERVTIQDVEGLGLRDRKDYTPDALSKMFSAKGLREARSVISSTHISYDTLFDWIYENLPVVLDSPRDLARGMEALSRADIHQTRAKRTQAYRLLKYMFNEMTGGVALSKLYSTGTGLLSQVREKAATLGFPPGAFTVTESREGIEVKPVKYLGNDWRRVNNGLREVGAQWVRGGNAWLIPYFRPPQLVWRYRRTYQSRRRRNEVAAKVAERCHISSKEAVAEVIPLVKVMVDGDPGMADEITGWLDLDDKQSKWLKN
jgi:DNA polymerase III delta prime subunit